MKTRKEMCVFILLLMLAPLLVWVASTTVHASQVNQSTGNKSAK